MAWHSASVWKGISERIEKDDREAKSLREQEQTLTNEWQELCLTLNVTLRPQQDISSWLSAQDAYEHQLYQLSQRLTLQSQINELRLQVQQYQQAAEARRTSLAAMLEPLGLTLPPEGEEAQWLAARTSEAELWQEKQSAFSALHEQIAQLTPLLDTLPEEAVPDAIKTVAWTTGGRYITIACRCTVSGKRYNSNCDMRRSARLNWRNSLPMRWQTVSLPIGKTFLLRC